MYQRECETSSNEIIQRRWKVIQMMYLDREKKKSTKEIAEFYKHGIVHNPEKMQKKASGRLNIDIDVRDGVVH